MGTDTALAVLSDRPRLLYDYFKQLFAQVTNPPLDAIREELVTSMGSTIGPERNLLEPEPESCRQIHIKYPIIHNEHVAKLRHLPPDAAVPVDDAVDAVRPGARTARGSSKAMDELCRRASEAVKAGYDILILSDRGVSRDLAPIPSLLATAGVHHHLVREGTRTRCALVVESGDAREVHHVSLLLGYGAGVVNPYVAFETIDDMIRAGHADRHRARQGDPALHQGAQQGRAEGDVEDGDLDAAELLRRADLRGDRPQPGVHRPLLHAHDVARRRRRHRRDRRGSAPAARARVRAPAGAAAGARAGRRVPVAARRRVPPVQPGDGVQAAARHAHRPVHDLQGVHPGRRRAEPAPRHAARAVPLQAGRSGRCRSTRSSRSRRSSSASPPARCPTARSARRRTRRWRSR